MTWTYDLTTIATAPVAQVRLLVGDTDSNDELLQDEEITYVIGIERGTYYAAARCCEIIASLYGRKVTTAVGDLKVSAEKKYEHYIELSAMLRRRAALGDAQPQAPAISISQKDTNRGDTDLVVPAFGRDTQRNPNIGPMDPLRSRSPWSTWP